MSLKRAALGAACTLAAFAGWRGWRRRRRRARAGGGPRLLVTGGLGFVGANVIAEFLSPRSLSLIHI